MIRCPTHINATVCGFDEMRASSELNPSSQASALRRLVERQPACLIRVRLDGVLLWCNRAAVGLLGVAARRAILSTNLIDRIPPAQRTEWQAFMRRCWEKGAASYECDLVIGDSDARRVLIQGVALRDRPDGFESLLLQVGASTDDDRAERQVVELQRKLEDSRLASLQKEREYGRDVAMLKAALAAAQAKTTAPGEKQQLEGLKPRSQTATAEQVRLQALVAEYEIDRTRIAADHQAAVDALEQRLAQALEEQGRMAARAEEQTREQDLMRAAHQRALGDLHARVELAERELHLLRTEHHRALADLEGATGAAAELRHHLSQASADQGRLAARLGEHERERDSLIADHHRALADMETRAREIAELRAEQVRLQAVVVEYEIDRTRTAADHQAAVDTLEQTLAQALEEQRRIAARAEEQTREEDLMRAAHQRALGDLHARVDVAERELDLRRADHDRALEQLIAEHHRALADVEAGKREALDEARSQQAQALADQRRLVARLEEHERERDSLIAEHRRVLADMETGKGEALAELRSQLSQAFADQRRLATRADDQELELDRLRAEHYAALTDVETRNRAVLADLRSELAQSAADYTRTLAARAEEHERDRARMSVEHSRAVADLQAGKEAAAAELRSQLAAAMAEHHRLRTVLEDGERERERMAAEHRRTIADLQATQQETVAESERLLLEVQQALLVRDASRRVEIERRLVDGIDEGPLTKADGERLASLQRGFTLAFSRMHAILKDGPAAKEPSDPEHEDADLLHEPFDDADDAFVQRLLEVTHATPRSENLPAPETVAVVQTVSETQAVTAADQSADAVFDAQDAAFARRLMSTHHAPRESVEKADAEPAEELPQAPPAPQDSSDE